MIARVAPLLRLPRALGVFDYRLPETMTVVVGSIVRIPFRRRSHIGVVLELASTSSLAPANILALNAVISQSPLLPLPQLQAAQQIAHEGFTSIATTLRSIIPSLRLRTAISLLPPSSPAPDRTWRNELDSLTGSQQDVALISYLNDHSRTTFYEHLVALAQKHHRSTLLIVPTIARLRAYARLFPRAFLLHHGLPARQYRELFLNIRNGQSLIVIGTRSAIFAPLTDLGLVIIDDEDADEHVQEEPSPRFDCRSVAAALVTRTGGKLVLMSRLPSLQSFLQYGVHEHLDAPPQITVAFVDLDEQRDQHDYRIVPDVTLAALQRVAAQGRRAVIVHHRRSLFGSLECRDCGFIPTCSICRVPLRQDGAVLVCRHCGQTANIPLTCPRCRGYSLRGRGRGIEYLVLELRRAGLKPVIAGATDSDRGLILVTTPSRLDELDLSEVTLAVITRYDSLLSVPRIDAEERARRILRMLAAKISVGGTLLVQGSRGYEELSRTVFDDRVLEQGREERERFGYPPAWNLLALRRRLVARAPGLTANELVRRLKRHDPTLLIIGPQRSRGRSRIDPGGDLVLLRYKKPLSPAVRRLLMRLDERWSMVPNPSEIH